MIHRPMARLGLICAVFCGTGFFAPAESVSDHAVRISATAQTNPPQITLSWPADARATNYTVWRKSRDDTDWGAGIPLATNATGYVDTNVAMGGAYEYGVLKLAANYYGEGFVYAGIETPLVEDRGKVVLLVDNTCVASLALELARLQQDLAGDGWTVLRHDVARMAVDPANTSSNVWAARANELAAVKALITSDYNADPANVKAVFLFGHVPVPYSGELAPDGHPDHIGAWPADAYYGDMSGAWTDSSVTNIAASDPRNRNAIGDGKFDQTDLPAAVTLQVGRVDLANLPAFSKSELDLLRQYLDKDHYFRHKFVTAVRRGLIDDHFGLLVGPSSVEAPGANGWMNFAAFFGASNSVASSDWFGALSTNSYLWGYGCGSGTYTSAGGVGSTADFARNDPRVVFTMLFGSRFGDWDSQNGFLRAPLATPTYTLTAAWAARPNWFFHHMALGETIGFSTRLTQNNNNVLYDGSFCAHGVHIALMGDPTLRMHPAAPPSALLIATNSSGGVDLNWNASPDAVTGYHVYRASAVDGPFTRLTGALIGETHYTDPVVTSNVYMVRAVKLETSASGSYYNPSQGIFQSLDGTFGGPGVVLLQPANNALFISPTAIQVEANTVDPANRVTSVAFYANGAKIGEIMTPPYRLAWSPVPLGDYSLAARANYGGGTVTNSGAVNVRVDNGASPRLAITALGNGAYAISGEDRLGRTYQIQFLGDASTTNWQTLGTATAGPSGRFQFIDSTGSPQGIYRSAYP